MSSSGVFGTVPQRSTCVLEYKLFVFRYFTFSNDRIGKVGANSLGYLRTVLQHPTFLDKRFSFVGFLITSEEKLAKLKPTVLATFKFY